jgi:predicted nuclease with RNAse H fold
VILVVA